MSAVHWEALDTLQLSTPLHEPQTVRLLSVWQPLKLVFCKQSTKPVWHSYWQRLSLEDTQE